MDTSDLLSKAREASNPRGDFSGEDAPLPPGYSQTTWVQPDPPEDGRFPLDWDTRHIEFGSVRICRRCKGIRNKRYEEYGFFVDPDIRGTRRRCRGCNGWGVVPNVGL